MRSNRRQVRVCAQPTDVVHMFMRDDNEIGFAHGRFHPVKGGLIETRGIAAALRFVERRIDDARGAVGINHLIGINRQVLRRPTVDRHHSGCRKMEIGDVLHAHIERLFATDFMRQRPHSADVEIKARVCGTLTFNTQPILSAGNKREDNRQWDH